MAATFEILAGFLERFGEEVEGRELQQPSEETKHKLLELAGGRLPEAQQAEVFALLNTNPQWLAWLAQEIKTLRTSKK